MDAIKERISALEYDLVQWANPTLAGKDPPTKSWYAVDLHTALAYVAGYLVLVAVGLVMKASDKGWKERAEAAKKGKRPSVAEKFSKQPVNIIAAIYNPLQVALCGYMMYEAARLYKEMDYKPICNAHDNSNTRMASIVWVFYISKIFDFMDTFVMVVKGSWAQLSFLHVYHHTSIFLFYWLNMNAAYDGDVYLTVILNGFVHFVMYSYYELTLFNVKVPMAIKASITNLQQIQFLIMNVQAGYILWNGCEYPNRIVVAYLLYIDTLMVLFRNFQKKNYSKEKDQKKDK